MRDQFTNFIREVVCGIRSTTRPGNDTDADASDPVTEARLLFLVKGSESDWATWFLTDLIPQTLGGLQPLDPTEKDFVSLEVKVGPTYRAGVGEVEVEGSEMK